MDPAGDQLLEFLGWVYGPPVEFCGWLLLALVFSRQLGERLRLRGARAAKAAAVPLAVALLCWLAAIAVQAALGVAQGERPLTIPVAFGSAALLVWRTWCEHDRARDKRSLSLRAAVHLH